MKLYKIMLLILTLAGANSALANSDSRIKTYEYSEDKVFRVVVHYGFQSSIEFAKGEEIETLSVGDSYAWKITPVDRRLFIKPLTEDIRTNMTIITNKRTYQFDVISKSDDQLIDKDMAYVIKFNYPNSAKQRKFSDDYSID